MAAVDRLLARAGRPPVRAARWVPSFAEPLPLAVRLDERESVEGGAARFPQASRQAGAPRSAAPLRTGAGLVDADAGQPGAIAERVVERVDETRRPGDVPSSRQAAAAPRVRVTEVEAAEVPVAEVPVAEVEVAAVEVVPVPVATAARALTAPLLPQPLAPPTAAEPDAPAAAPHVVIEHISVVTEAGPGPVADPFASLAGRRRAASRHRTEVG